MNGNSDLVNSKIKKNKHTFIKISIDIHMNAHESDGWGLESDIWIKTYIENGYCKIWICIPVLPLNTSS